MKSNKIVVKLMAGVIIAGVTLSAGTTAFANTKDKVSSKIQTLGTEKREAFKQGFFGGDIKAQLDTLVKDGTITQAQKDKVVEYMNKKDEARKAEMEKIKAMTEEERKAYFETNTAKVRIDLFKELVDAGILNQAQADAAKKLLPQHKELKRDKTIKIRGDKSTTLKVAQE